MGIRRRHSLASKPARVARLTLAFGKLRRILSSSMSRERKQSMSEFPRLGELPYVGVADRLDLDYLPLVDRSDAAEAVEIHVERDVVRSGLTRVVYPGAVHTQPTNEVPLGAASGDEQALLDYVNARIHG